MTVLNDAGIKRLCIVDEDPMIEPFIDFQSNTINNGDPIVSYGLSCASYDIRLGEEIRRIVPIKDHDGALYRQGNTWYDPIIDKPEVFFKREFGTKGTKHILQPKEFILAHTMEKFCIPTNICANLLDKSTWARNGITVQNTLLEPGWKGVLTLEIVNHLPIPVALTVGSGIGQLVFHELSGKPNVPYNMRNGGNGGKYQGQTGVTPHLIQREDE